MKPPVNRRELLQRGVVAGAAGVALLAEAGCTDIRLQASKITGPEPNIFVPLPSEAILANGVLHASRRVGFGPRPGDLAHIAEIGARNWIEEQLADSKEMEEDPAVGWRVNGLDTQQTERDAPDALFSMSYEQLLLETQQSAILRAVYSRHQLRENMADFWTNHFNIYAPKSDGQAMVPVDAETVIRSNIWNFPQMLMASAKSPAMLNYLDNKLNHRGVANENYARELLELHTLGVKSGYTLKDIQGVARCLTGWTIKTGFNRGQFEYVDALHDDGAKFIPFLNLTIAPGGKQRDAETVIHTLSTHPTVGKFIASKLCSRFLGCVPPDVVNRSAAAFVSSKGDVRAMLRPVLLDALFVPDENRPILKRPLDMMVSALRALGADTDGGEPLQNHLANMGQPLYQWPMPDGFPEKPSAWSGSILPRWNFALALCSNAIDDTRVDLNAPASAARAVSDEEKLRAAIETVLCVRPDSPDIKQTSEQLRGHVNQARSLNVSEEQIAAESYGLLIASPAFQWK
jgi:uncharacterized protein (DUF1800 family)